MVVVCVGEKCCPSPFSPSFSLPLFVPPPPPLNAEVARGVVHAGEVEVEGSHLRNSLATDDKDTNPWEGEHHNRLRGWSGGGTVRRRTLRRGHRTGSLLIPTPGV